MSERRNLEAESLPLENFTRAAAHLRRPFAPGAVKWKVQSIAGGRGMVVGYIDARLAIERLNLVIPEWWDDYEVVDGNWLRCRLTVGGITRQDVGTGKDRKAQFSDALKRAAVKFGIGVSLYAMRQMWIDGSGDGKTVEGTPRLKKTRSGNKESLAITVDAEKWLRDNYAAWLGLEGRGKVFGPPLDHGDDPEGSVGEAADVEAEPSAAGDDAPTLSDAERAGHVEVIEGAYEQLKALNGRTPITKGQLDAMIAGATTQEEFDAIAEQIRTKIKEGTDA